jgi:hypothetical protein
MNYDKLTAIIGASGFVLYEECYEYNEDACYLAGDKEAAKKFMLNCGYSESEYRIDAVSFADIMKDYGYSSGEYAMERKACSEFKRIAEENSVNYESKEFYCDSMLMVVNINTTQEA